MTGAQASLGQTLQALTNTPQYQANIARLFAALPPEVFRRCPTLVSTGSSVMVIEPVSFAADGYPVAGLWKQSFPVSGCGNDTTINFYFQAQPDEKITSTTAAPGDTHAGLVLQRDAIKYVWIAVGAKSRGCSSLHLRTTQFKGNLKAEPVGSKASGQPLTAPWQEIWSVAGCGQVYDIPLTFVPDATGTTISTVLKGG